MFIRAKQFKYGRYFYLVEDYRKDGKVKQRVVKYLGRKIPDEYLADYRKRGSRASYPKTERNPTRLTLENSGGAKGVRHGSKKTRKVL